MNHHKHSIKPSLFIALMPVFFLIMLLAINIIVFKDSATSGPNQLALLFSAVFAAIISVKYLKVSYKKVEKHAIHTISVAMQANIILLVVGAVIGVWILSGVVPTMIYYGIKIINPNIFLPLSCIICSIVSCATGSSWSTGGTVGIALMGIGQTLGIPVEMTAGAVISGAYFGDKMSPLSDTTNLAPALSGSELFEHIKHMAYNSLPLIVITYIIFGVIGLFFTPKTTSLEQIEQVITIIDANFKIGWHLMLVPLAVVVLVAFKAPAIPAMIFALFIGAIFAFLFQTDLIAKTAGEAFTMKTAYQVILTTAYKGFSISTGNSVIDSLFSRGGMSSMLNTVWLILMAMLFSGVMEVSGMLNTLAESILKLVKGTTSLIAATLGSTVVLNLTASDQYLAIVVSAKLFKSAYKKFGLKARNLSRTVEEGATVTSVLVPWNSCGAYFSSVLGVSTLSYLPYCFFNYLSPVVAIIAAAANFKQDKYTDEEMVEIEKELEVASNHVHA